MTAIVNGTLAPAAGAAGMLNALGRAPARDAAVPEKTVVAPDAMTTFSFAHRSVAVPFNPPLFDCVQVAPGVRVKVLAGTVPTFLIVIAVLTVFPGVIVVLPPNLLIVEHVAAFVETVPESALRQVTVLPAFCSCITRAPVAAVFALLVILATKPDSVPDIDSDSTTVPRRPAVIVRGANRTRLAVVAGM